MKETEREDLGEAGLDLGDLSFLEEPAQPEEALREDLPVTKLILSQMNPPRDPSAPPVPGSVTRRGKGIAIFFAAAAILAVVLAAAAIGWTYYNAMLNRIQRPEEIRGTMSPEDFAYWATYNPEGSGTASGGGETQEMTLAPTMPPVEGDYITNILVIGQDYREGEATKLADSILLCSLNRKSNTLTLTSFLRDGYIQMPSYKGHNCGKNRINVVYNLGWQWGGERGGMEMMDLCLKNNFGIQVDYNAEINFRTFEQIINLIGGVEVELTEAEVNYLKKDITGFNNYVDVGHNHLDGYTTLCYARARKLDGDVQRTDRQRKVVASIVDKARAMTPGELHDLVWQVLPLVTTDMTNDQITDLLKDVIPMLKGLKIQAFTCPAEHTYWGKMIDIGGYPSSVLDYHLQPNQTLLQWICEVPAFEASPDQVPEFETLPPPRPQKSKETTQPSTEPSEVPSDPTAAPSDPTTAPETPSENPEGPTEKPVTPPETQAPPPEKPVTPPETQAPPTEKPVTPSETPDVPAGPSGAGENP